MVKKLEWNDNQRRIMTEVQSSLQISSAFNHGHLCLVPTLFSHRRRSPFCHFQHSWEGSFQQHADTNSADTKSVEFTKVLDYAYETGLAPDWGEILSSQVK